MTSEEMSKEEIREKIKELEERPLEAYPLFMTSLPEEAEENVALSAIQALLHEDTPYQQALNFKHQGNECFLLGTPAYKDALAFYTRGLEVRCGDKALEAILHCNRAAVLLGLGRWSEAFGDARMALSLDPETTKVKAHRRLLMAALKLRRPVDARDSFDRLTSFGIQVDEATREELDNLEKEFVAKEAKRRDREAALEEIRQIVGDCGVKVEAGAERSLLEHFESAGPLTDFPSVHQSPKSQRRMWPVMLFYPAAAQSDFLASVDESTSIKELLQLVFAESPEWDRSGAYRVVSHLRVFWHDSQRNGLVEVKQSRCIYDLLGTVIKVIERGILGLYVCPQGSDADQLIARFSSLEKF